MVGGRGKSDSNDEVEKSWFDDQGKQELSRNSATEGDNWDDRTKGEVDDNFGKSSEVGEGDEKSADLGSGVNIPRFNDEGATPNCHGNSAEKIGNADLTKNSGIGHKEELGLNNPILVDRPKVVIGHECKIPSRDESRPSGSFGEGPTEIVAGPVDERFLGEIDGDEVRKSDQEDSCSTATVDFLVFTHYK
ncbi:hypothetical protein L6452_19369 [Arctium lappa]|uniref:Uncharacterized protein n=1 Tax=Arctium lappa TaxID=4217 RepID=A0ACB9BCT8_ARCLA|nr:hypothetical protein L6452_19369 [Arctium lappa]